MQQAMNKQAHKPANNSMHTGKPKIETHHPGQIGQTGQTGQMEPPKKKSKWWLWLILVLIVIGAGVGIFIWLYPFG